jgi:hypothetical protein
MSSLGAVGAAIPVVGEGLGLIGGLASLFGGHPSVNTQPIANAGNQYNSIYSSLPSYSPTANQTQGAQSSLAQSVQQANAQLARNPATQQQQALYQAQGIGGKGGLYTQLADQLRARNAASGNAMGGGSTAAGISPYTTGLLASADVQALANAGLSNYQQGLQNQQQIVNNNSGLYNSYFGNALNDTSAQLSATGGQLQAANDVAAAQLGNANLTNQANNRLFSGFGGLGFATGKTFGGTGLGYAG